MQDIDFDELDRAVNTVIGGGPSDDKNNDDSNSSSDVNQVESNQEAQQAPESAESTMPVPTPLPTPAPMPASRRASSGRFMDMVHPSSDMRSRTTGQPVLKPISEAPKPQYEAPKPLVEAESSDQDWSQPLESPFLPDARVEKRPLGGSPTDDFLNSSSGLTFEEYMDAPDEELLEASNEELTEETSSMPDPIDFAAAAVSEEVDSAETAIEERADEVVEAPQDTFEAAPEEAPIEQPTYEEPAPIIAPTVEEPVGPTSITPQYKEQPVTEQTSGAILDTESYHQPVTQPVKKKASWLIILWIFLVVILGAGVGAAIYFFVLPML